MKKKIVMVGLIATIGFGCVIGICLRSNAVGAEKEQSKQNSPAVEKLQNHIDENNDSGDFGEPVSEYSYETEEEKLQEEDETNIYLDNN